MQQADDDEDELLHLGHAVRAINTADLEGGLEKKIEAAMASHELEIEVQRLKNVQKQIVSLQERIESFNGGPGRLGKLYDRMEELKDEEIEIFERIAKFGTLNEKNGETEMETISSVKIANKKAKLIDVEESEGHEQLSDTLFKVEEANLSDNEDEAIADLQEDDYLDSAYKERLEYWSQSVDESMEIARFLRPLEEQLSIPFNNAIGISDGSGELQCPKALWSKLLGYQRQGLSWLANLYKQKVGGILGDEMGLGKTVQIIAFIASLQASGKLRQPVLIVAPVTLLRQWLQEFRLWWPPLRVLLLHSSTKAYSSGSILRKALSYGHVLLTSYGHLAKLQQKMVKAAWRLIVLDEGHKIRNPDAAITLVCKQLRTPHRLILSGTPIQNNLTELWSLFDFCYPGRLGVLPVFRNEFAIPINAGGYVNASSLQVQTSYKCACHLRDLVKPYLLRRLKADVAHELPKKQEQVLFCQLSPYQRDLYEWILESDVIKSVLAGKRHILSGIDLLRKLCNHPGLLGLTEGLEDWPGFPEPYGEVSGKLTVVGETLRLWKERGHRVLLFCQTRQMLDFVEEYICEHPTGYNYLRMDGNTAVKERGKLVDRFNADQNIHVFLLTTKVGGLGLNLVGADRVLIYDPDWNPSTDLQARERAWRLGQTRPVTIYRLITAGTIEEKVYHRQIFKQYLTNRVLNDPKQSRFFKSSDLYDLFSLAPPQEHTGTETGELFSGLDLEIKRRLNASDRNGNAGEESGNPGGGDSHILESLFEMTGLHSALQHDQLVEKPRFEAILIEKEAARIAGEAAEALRRSREERLGQAIEKVTWTGNLRDLSKASSECMQRPMQPSSAPTLPSSASILAAIRRRNAPVLPASAELLDRPFAAILERLLLFFEENQGVCKSATIAERFRDVLEPGQEAAFRHLLRTIAVFDRIGKAWRLKPDLLQLN